MFTRRHQDRRTFAEGQKVEFWLKVSALNISKYAIITTQTSIAPPTTQQT